MFLVNYGVKVDDDQRLAEQKTVPIVPKNEHRNYVKQSSNCLLKHIICYSDEKKRSVKRYIGVK